MTENVAEAEAWKTHILTYFRQTVSVALLDLGLKGPSLRCPSYPFLGGAKEGGRSREGDPLDWWSGQGRCQPPIHFPLAVKATLPDVQTQRDKTFSHV